MITGFAKGSIVVALGLVLVTTPAIAQRPGLEFGFQFAQLTRTNPEGAGNNNTVFRVGPTSTSLAWYANPMIAIEPTLILFHVSPETGNSTNQVQLQVAVPIYLNKGWGKAGGIFIAPEVGMIRSSSGGVTNSQTHYGASVGTKLKINDALFWRVQGGFDMGAAHDVFPKYTNLAASFGLSVYLH